MQDGLRFDDIVSMNVLQQEGSPSPVFKTKKILVTPILKPPGTATNHVVKDSVLEQF